MGCYLLGTIFHCYKNGPERNPSFYTFDPSIWNWGVLLLLIQLQKDGRFLQTFSSKNWFSIVFLAIIGVSGHTLLQAYGLLYTTAINTGWIVCHHTHLHHSRGSFLSRGTHHPQEGRRDYPWFTGSLFDYFKRRVFTFSLSFGLHLWWFPHSRQRTHLDSFHCRRKRISFTVFTACSDHTDYYLRIVHHFSFYLVEMGMESSFSIVLSGMDERPLFGNFLFWSGLSFLVFCFGEKGFKHCRNVPLSGAFCNIDRGLSPPE